MLWRIYRAYVNPAIAGKQQWNRIDGGAKTRSILRLIRGQKKVEPIEVSKYIRKFLNVLTLELMQDGGIPCAFAVMTVSPVAEHAAQFNIVEGAAKELLPQGADEVRQFLAKALRDWENINYPDQISIDHSFCGHA